MDTIGAPAAGLVGECWAIREESMEAALQALRTGQNTAPPAAGITDRAHNRMGLATIGPVAVLPLHGIITPRPTWLGWYFGWTSAQEFGMAFDAALASPDVKAIVLDADSPGGSVYGVPELAARIARGRGTKPVLAVANALMASAAYWIASAADQVIVTPSGEAGSIGVMMVHQDRSAANERDGIRYTLLRAGKYKVEANDLEPLTDSARAYLQGRIDDYYSMFTEAVARYRMSTPEMVRTGFGQGRVVGAQDAVRLGLADRVGTLDQVLEGALALASGRQATISRARAVRVLESEAGRPVAQSPSVDRERRLRLLEADTATPQRRNH